VIFIEPLLSLTKGKKITQKLEAIQHRIVLYMCHIITSLCYHIITSLSLIMQGICAILGHSFPPLLLQFASNKGHHLMVNTERDEGSPSSGKDSSFRPYAISRFSREVRCCSHFPSKHFRYIRKIIYV
jgi:hypothetical protein